MGSSRATVQKGVSVMRDALSSSREASTARSAEERAYGVRGVRRVRRDGVREAREVSRDRDESVDGTLAVVEV